MLKTEEMSTLRLQYIKVRDKITEMESACEKLDKIGDNYTIMDYEQLKIERRNHTDKIEERDEELSRLRTQCSNAIQCLAHIREKLSAVQDNIVMATINLDDVEKQRFQVIIEIFKILTFLKTLLSFILLPSYFNNILMMEQRHLELNLSRLLHFLNFNKRFLDTRNIKWQ